MAKDVHAIACVAGNHQEEAGMSVPIPHLDRAGGRRGCVERCDQRSWGHQRPGVGAAAAEPGAALPW